MSKPAKKEEISLAIRHIIVKIPLSILKARPSNCKAYDGTKSWEWTVE